nr:hypothetical protein [Chlamydiota bacterium]
MTSPISSSLIKPLSSEDTRSLKKEGASLPKAKLPPFLGCGTSARMDLFRMLFEAGIVDDVGMLQGKYATIEFPELTEDEIKVLRDKRFTPLAHGISVGEFLAVFCKEQTTEAVNLIGSYVFYFLFFELPNYLNRLFVDFPTHILEKLAELKPLALPTDKDIAVDLKDQLAGSYFDKHALEKARDLFLAPLGRVPFKKNDPIDKGFKQYVTIDFPESDIEISLRGQIPPSFLFSFTSFYIPLKSLIQGFDEPIRPTNGHGSSSDRPQNIQGAIDGLLGILRGEDEHYLRYVSYITKGWTPVKRMTLDSYRSSKTSSELIFEIKQFLSNHHSQDPLEAFACLFNFCCFLEADDQKKGEICREFYLDHPKPEEEWAKHTIGLLVEKGIPFSQLVATLHHGFLLCHAFPEHSKIHVDLEQIALQPALKARIRNSSLLIPYSPKSTLPHDRELMQLLEQIIPHQSGSKEASSCSRLFKMVGRPSQIELLSSLGAKASTARLINLLKKVKRYDKQITLATFLAHHLLKEISTPPNGRELATLSQGLVFLIGGIKDPALAEEILKIGIEKKLIKSRERTWGWVSILKSQLKATSAESIFQRWRELRTSGSILLPHLNQKSVEFLLALAARMPANEELAQELCALKIPHEREKKADDYLVATLIALNCDEGVGERLRASMSESCQMRVSVALVKRHLTSNRLIEAAKAYAELKKDDSLDLPNQFVSVLGKLKSPTLQEFCAVERVIQSVPSCQTTPLLTDFSVASLSLPQNDRWKLDVSLSKRLLNGTGKHPTLPSLLEWIITTTGEMSLSYSSCSKLRNEMQRAISSLLSLQIDPAQLFSLFEAMNLGALSLAWNHEVEDLWVKCQEMALKTKSCSLDRIERSMTYPTRCKAKVSCEKLWVAIGERRVEKGDVTRVETCVKEVSSPEHIDFLLRAYDCFLKGQQWESAVGVLEQIFSIDEDTFESVWPKFAEPLSRFNNYKLRAKRLMDSGLVKKAGSKAHPLVKAATHKLLRSKYPSERNYAPNLLQHFIHLFEHGEAALWVRVLRQLAVDKADKFWLTFRKANNFISEDSDRHQQVWDLALNVASKRSAPFVFDVVLEEGLFPFGDEKSMWDRVCETALTVISKTHSPRIAEVLTTMMSNPSTSLSFKLVAAMALLKSRPSPKEVQLGLCSITSVID